MCFSARVVLSAEGGLAQGATVLCISVGDLFLLLFLHLLQ